MEASMADKGKPLRSAAGRSGDDVAGNDSMNRRSILLGSSSVLTAAALASVAAPQTARAQVQRPSGSTGRPPNILVSRGGDIGTWNISVNNRGMRRYTTPNNARMA